MHFLSDQMSYIFVNIGIKSQYKIYFDTKYFFAVAIFDWNIFYINNYALTFACYVQEYLRASWLTLKYSCYEVEFTWISFR